ncbi:MAG: SAM-dependent methyltransferase [candidate division Zixibacteria bacterium HGW-Zixibacteria-1]|nr:MAG: SAM-dependent methyltransferase [candidate division Zixibacteria bacterium HGW-Zixibacteria-1]
MRAPADSRVAGSFRDPAGFIFSHGSALYRQVNLSYRDNYDHLIDSGLYRRLVEANLLVAHEETDHPPIEPEAAYKVIKPRRIEFISYPYEWCFSQLKDAALATLEIQKQALECSMTLKDASAYNIQFDNGRPILIDTLSFEKYIEGEPWLAYRQFCRHFLAPLALMSYLDIRFGQLMRVHLDGIPLDMTAALLPWRTWLSLPLLAHIHLHVRSQRHFKSKSIHNGGGMVSRNAMLGLIDSLESAVRKLKWRRKKTLWADYYDNNNYDSAALEHKQQLVSQYIDMTMPTRLWDLGANNGRFSRLAAEKGAFTVAFDLDYGAVEEDYIENIRAGERRILPLVLDLVNPSSGTGWAHRERMSLLERAPADTVMALALIHHLAIGDNLAFGQIAHFFRAIGQNLIIEFVPKDDSQVQRMLASRRDIFDDYTQEAFEKAFAEHFNIIRSEPIIDTRRTLYLMSGR